MAQLLGPSPGESASAFVYTAAAEKGARSLDAAKDFVQFLKGRDAVSALKAKGFQPE